MRLRAVGLGVTPAGEKVTISNVAFGSYAKRIGLESGYEIVSVLEPAERPSRAIPAIIALVIAAGVAGLQFARRRKARRAGAGLGIKKARHEPGFFCFTLSFMAPSVTGKPCSRSPAR